VGKFLAGQSRSKCLKLVSSAGGFQQEFLLICGVEAVYPEEKLETRNRWLLVTLSNRRLRAYHDKYRL